jgi:hypothetical protein
MYMVIRKYYIIPGSSPALQQRAQTELVPLLRQIPGFLTHYLLPVGEDKIVSISLFDSKGNADLASGPTGFWMRHLSSALGDCILGLPEIIAGQTGVYSGMPLASQPEPAALRAQFEARLAGMV